MRREGSKESPDILSNSNFTATDPSVHWDPHWHSSPCLASGRKTPVFTLEELYDTNTAKLLSNPTGAVVTKQESRRYQQLLKDQPDGYTVEYFQEHRFGRLTARAKPPAKPYVYLTREVRCALAGPLYYDVDMVNCHPAIATQYAQKYGLPHDALHFYTGHREDALYELGSNWGIDSGTAKQVRSRWRMGALPPAQ